MDATQLWINYFDGDKEPLYKFIEESGYTASLDFPIIAIVDELLERNSNAKVLLSIRDTPQQWIKSFRDTIWRVMNMPFYTNILQYCGPPMILGTNSFGKDLHYAFFKHMIIKVNIVRKEPLNLNFWELSDEELAEFYLGWIDFIKMTVPKEKLLILNVKDGIASLAKFAGKPVPSWPMPRVNETTEFKMGLKLCKFFSVLAILGATFILTFIVQKFSGNENYFLLFAGIMLESIPFLIAKKMLRQLNESGHFASMTPKYMKKSK